MRIYNVPDTPPNIEGTMVKKKKKSGWAVVYCGIKLSSQSHNKSLFLVYGSQKRLQGLLLLVAMKSGKGSIRAVMMAGEDGNRGGILAVNC